MSKLYRNILFTAIILAAIAVYAAFFIKKKTTQLSPQAKVEFSEKDFSIKMVYCQPSKKGRLIFGPAEDKALQPFGKYWRLGANEATTIETSKDLMIKGQKLAKGIYSIYAVPGEEVWKIGINAVANRWGASEPDYTKDIFVVDIPVNATNESKEQFTIYIEAGEIVFWWDTTIAVLPYELAQ